MRDHERAMLAYLELAAISHEKHQPLGRDRFLILAGAEACRAGWPEVADRCGSIVRAANPVHLVGRFSTFADAMRDAGFTPLVAQLERTCPLETAEALLAGQGVSLDALRGAEETAGDAAERSLGRMTS